MRKALTALALAAAIGMLAGQAAYAQSADYPADGAPLTVNDSRVVRGQLITIRGSGARPHAIVRIYFFSDPILVGTTRADGDGNFSISVSVPSGVAAGGHTLSAVSNGVTLASVAVTVAGSGSGSASGSGSLPFTGSNTLPGIAIGVVLILLGSTTLLVSRRRREKSEAAS
jgi:LPXTG-motif cell wall-anchored protein